MKTNISPENELFIDQQVADGTFPNRQAALDAAVELLRQRSDTLARIDKRREQLDQGEFTEYDESSLKKRFNDLKSLAQGESVGLE